MIDLRILGKTIGKAEASEVMKLGNSDALVYIKPKLAEPYASRVEQVIETLSFIMQSGQWQIHDIEGEVVSEGPILDLIKD